MPSQDLRKAKQVVLDFFSLYTSYDYDRIVSIIDSNYKDNSPAQARGPEDVIAILKLVSEIFPDLTCDVLHIFAKNGDVALRISFLGTHSQAYAGVPASGKKIRSEALELFRVRNDKIVESWGYWPDHEMIKQMSE